MTERKPAGGARSRQDRLSAALRANLKRRKTQARVRAGSAPAATGAPESAKFVPDKPKS